MTSDKYLFLDVDGVLNTFGTHGDDCAELPPALLSLALREATSDAYMRHLRYNYMAILDGKIALLNEVLRAVPEVQLVMSSDWRRNFSLGIQNELFKARGLIKPFVSYTLIFPKAERGDEIEAWLDDHADGVANTVFAVVDDQSRDNLIPVRHRLITTGSWVGLLPEHVTALINMLNTPPGIEGPDVAE